MQGFYPNTKDRENMPSTPTRQINSGINSRTKKLDKDISAYKTGKDKSEHKDASDNKSLSRSRSKGYADKLRKVNDSSQKKHKGALSNMNAHFSTNNSGKKSTSLNRLQKAKQEERLVSGVINIEGENTDVIKPIPMISTNLSQPRGDYTYTPTRSKLPLKNAKPSDSRLHHEEESELAPPTRVGRETRAYNLKKELQREASRPASKPRKSPSPMPQKGALTQAINRSLGPGNNQLETTLDKTDRSLAASRNKSTLERTPSRLKLRVEAKSPHNNPSKSAVASPRRESLDSVDRSMPRVHSALGLTQSPSQILADTLRLQQLAKENLTMVEEGQRKIRAGNYNDFTRDLTFTPKINRYSQHLDAKRKQMLQTDRIEQLRQQGLDYERRKMRLQREKMRNQEEKLLEVCTFKPALTPPPPGLTLPSPGTLPQRSALWLQKREVKMKGPN